MADNEGKRLISPKLDDDAPEKGTAIEPEAVAASEGEGKRSPGKAAKTAAKASPPSTRRAVAEEEDDDDDDDDDYDDEEEDEEEEEEEEAPPPPPKRTASAKAKAAPVATKKGKAAVARKPVARVPARPRRPARYYVPYVGLGLGFVALHVWFDFPYQPIACLGIAIVIWAYLQIGSANEIVPGER